MPEIDTADLSPRAREIVETIGVTPALALFSEYGGVRLYVPERARSYHPLADLLGNVAFGALVARYAREYIDVPKAHRATLAVRDRAICAAHARGTSVRRLALAHRLTERRIYHILADSGIVEDRQARLL